MRALLALLVPVIALMAAPGSASAATHPCEPAESETIVRNSLVRVYSTGFNEDFFACSYENRRTMSLGYVSSSSAGFFDVDDFQLAGRYLAYRRVECAGLGGSGCEVNDLILIDMRKLEVRLRKHSGSKEGVSKFVLKASGSYALLYFRDRPDGREYVLRRRDRRGGALLAVGMNAAAPIALRLIGSTLHWQQAGVDRTKTLQ